MNLVETLASGQPDAWSAARFEAAVGRAAEALRAGGTRVLATLFDNGIAWLVADEGAARAGVVHVPLPGFFTRGQLQHALVAAGVDTLWTAPAAAASFPGAPSEPLSFDADAEPIAALRLPAVPVAMPAGTAKLTFTSGTTGTPKGVCLGRAAMDRVAQAIGEATATLDITRHLSALPFAVLLENIAGVMAPRLREATCIALPLESVGLQGSSRFDPSRLQDAVESWQPHSLILLPQMLRAWTMWLRATGRRAPASLRLVAVGGAAVGAPLLQSARELGIPAFEGYGLSEGASVQTLNLPGADRPGSAGRPLPHARLRIAADGEIEVAGSAFLGYLGSEAPPPAWWPSGDLGAIDPDGFLHVQGRKKQVLITAYGRNVSPEWVETALQGALVGGLLPIGQAVVFGDGQPALSAVLWPLRADLPDAALQAAVDEANAGLPDYARVRRWVRARAAFDADAGLATANGRPQRAAIERLHRDVLVAPPLPSILVTEPTSP
ncbi:AMP-binding protein [Methylibium sp.]|jgi:long-subunit acyl-CoA synthetase (AMP-forming)|uniref:AMP-binding protein n=1 Tax=Methylibium sp. TaxID=2067992 RepID=UPI003D0E20C1